MTMLDHYLGTLESEVESTVLAVETELADSLADEKERELFLLAFVEAINNAAEHGNQWAPLSRIRVRGHFRPGLALVSVEDDGPGFPPSFPNLPEVQGKRGRGLGFIREFTDQVLFNREGNQIAFWKGGPSVSLELKHGEANIARLPGDVVVVTEFIPRGGIFDAMGELLDIINQIGWKRLFLNLGDVKLLTSTAWGSIFAEAGRPDAELLVLFNSPVSVVSSAQAMGIDRRRDTYARLVVAPDFREPFMLLCQSLEMAG